MSLQPVGPLPGVPPAVGWAIQPAIDLLTGVMTDQPVTFADGLTVKGGITSSGGLNLSSALPVSQGGTGSSMLTQNGVLYGNGSSAIGATAAGGFNTVLTANGGAPSFSSTPTVASLTLSDGNLTFSGTAQRIRGDFSNATELSRLIFQTTSSSANTIVDAMPSGSGTIAQWKALSTTDPTNTQFGLIGADGGGSRVLISANKVGSPAVPSLQFAVGGTVQMDITSSGVLQINTLAGAYNSVTTTGWGIPAIYGYNRATGQTAAVGSVATYTVGAADGSFIVSGNVLVTASTTHNFALQVTYTSEDGTGRTVTMNTQQVGGTLVTAITNVTGAGPYEGVPLHIRAKASTAITVLTSGTFTSVTYNVEGAITQVA